MVSILMIQDLAELVGRDDPEVTVLVENARMFLRSRDSAYRILLGLAKSKGLNLGKELAFGLPTDLPGEGLKIGDIMIGDSAHGECRISKGELPGNVGVFGGAGTGKSSVAGHLCEGWFEDGPKVIILDVADEYGWLIHRYPVEKLMVIKARHFPLGIFVNPSGSCLSEMAYLSQIVGVLRESLYLRDGSCNLLLKIVGGMYRERGVLDGTRDYPTVVEVFEKLITNKFSVQSRHAGFLETLVNRFHGLIQSFPGMNAKRSLAPEEVTRRNLIVRMADMSPSDIEIFTGVFLCWLMAYRGGKL